MGQNFSSGARLNQNPLQSAVSEYTMDAETKPHRTRCGAVRGKLGIRRRKRGSSSFLQPENGLQLAKTPGGVKGGLVLESAAARERPAGQAHTWSAGS